MIKLLAVEFPSAMQVSSFKAIEDVEKMAKDEDGAGSNYAQQFLKQVKKHPWLTWKIDKPLF